MVLVLWSLRRSGTAKDRKVNVAMTGPRSFKDITVGPNPYLWELLIKAREASGLSQKAFAEHLGIYQPQLSQLETGKLYDLRVSELVHMAGILGLQPNALVAAAYISHINPRGDPKAQQPKGMSMTGRAGRGNRIDALIPSADAGSVRIALDGTLIRGPAHGDGGIASPSESEEDPMYPKPTLHWAGVAGVPITMDDIPFADGEEESGGYDPNLGGAATVDPFHPDGSGLPNT